MNLSSLTERFQALARELLQAYREESPKLDKETSPELMVDAMQQLLDVLYRLEHDRFSANAGKVSKEDAKKPLSTQELHELGEYGIRLLTELSEQAKTLNMDHHRRELENLTLPLAIWIVRCGGELSYLDPVVNSLAAIANQLSDPAELEELYRYASNLVDATSPVISQDLDKSDPARPWRVLLLNRAIIATRTYRPDLMKEAFDHLLKHLPEEAPAFFREGMEQMDTLDYPAPVKEIMEAFFHQWGKPRILH